MIKFPVKISVRDTVEFFEISEITRYLYIYSSLGIFIIEKFYVIDCECSIKHFEILP